MTKKAWFTFKKEYKITCTTNGEKDENGTAIWRDENGKPYTLNYARLTKTYAFVPMKEDARGEYK